jgi:hypothetical protein
LLVKILFNAGLGHYPEQLAPFCGSIEAMTITPSMRWLATIAMMCAVFLLFSPHWFIEFLLIFAAAFDESAKTQGQFEFGF